MILHMMSIWSNQPDQDSVLKTDSEEQLIYAAIRGNVDQVKDYLEKGVDVNSSTDDGITALIGAASEGKYSVCKLLIEKGANLNLKQQNGLTALHVSILSNRNKIAQLLIENNADFTITDEFGRTPVLYAVSKNDTTLVDFLYKKGANKNDEDFDGFNALMIATINNNLTMVNFLLSVGANVNSTDIKGVTALMVAVSKQNKELTKALIQAGAEINHLNKSRQSALSIAIEYQYTAMVDLLIQNGADVNLKHSFSEMPLTIAKYCYSNDTIFKLLQDKDARDNAIPVFKKPSISVEVSANPQDFLAGIGIGIKEVKSNMDFTLGFNKSIFSNRLIIQNDEQYYKFWEDRNVFYLAINKNFKFKKGNHRFQHGVFIGLRPMITFSELKSTTYQLDNKVGIQPDGGYYLTLKSFQFNLAYSYYNIDAYQFNPHRLTLTMRLFPTSGRVFDTDNYKKIDNYDKD